MLRISKWLVIVFFLMLQGCGSMPMSQMSFSDEGLLIDHANALAEDDETWFDAVKASQQELQQAFDGEINPGLAMSLELDLHIHDDEQITTYLTKIVDRLLTGWQGVKPEISIVIESDEFFSAYVTEHHQLHLSTGVFRVLDNEDQLASLLAHELSHVLLKHNHEKSLVRSTLSSLDFAELLSADVGSIAGYIDKGSDVHQSAKYAKLGFSSMGLILADIFAPSWSRKNELEADRLGMDLVMRAGYNYEEFPKMLDQVYDAQVGKSERLRKLSKKIDGIIHENFVDSNKNQWEAIVETVKAEMAIKAKNMIIEEVALNTKEHEDREIRIDVIKQYIGNEYDDDLPPEVSLKPYQSVVGGNSSKARLAKDLKAIKVLNALNNEEFEVAKKKANKLRVGTRQDVISGVIAKSLVEVWNKNARAATHLDRLIKNKIHAPAEAYTKLAEIYVANKRYKQAEDVLKLGIKRIGRDYKFLPSLVHLKVAAGKMEEAESYTLECQKYDTERRDSIIMTLLGANSIYYEKCASILGYDVRTGKNPASSLMQGLQGLQENLGSPIRDRLNNIPFRR